jgi:hypothetical protein
MKQRIFKVREIAYKKGSKFLAVSLDLDLMAEGETMGQAIDRLREATDGYLKMCCKDGESDKEIYRKAPQKYFDLYELFRELDGKSEKKPIENFVGKATYHSSVSHAKTA